RSEWWVVSGELRAIGVSVTPRATVVSSKTHHARVTTHHSPLTPHSSLLPPHLPVRRGGEDAERVELQRRAREDRDLAHAVGQFDAAVEGEVTVELPKRNEGDLLKGELTVNCVRVTAHLVEVAVGHHHAEQFLHVGV